MAKIEINVNDIATDLSHLWKKKKRGKDDKHKDKQGEPVRQPKQK